jgi:hypothetical protein
VVKKSNFVSLLLVTLMMVGTLPAQVSQVQPPDHATILTASESILKEVSQMRGLPAKNPVKSGFKSRKELETIIIDDMDEENRPEELVAQSKLLERLGLIPKGYALREQMINLLKEQIGGFYEPRTGEFYLVDWLELDEQKPVIAHELMHAIQDQNFNLRRFEKFPKDQSDQELAIQALIEGEATVIMLNYIFKPQGLDITKVPVPLLTIFDSANKGDDGKFPVLTAAPAAIRESLEFPYFYGAAFVQSIVHKNSWQKLSDLYTTDLPESTEQIMHPEKYIEHDRPVKIMIPDISEKLGKGWRKNEVNIQGEFGLYLILGQYLDKKAAKEAAAGWGGDQYVFYDRADNNDSMIAQFTTWDQEKDAVEFFSAYSERTLKRYKEAKLVKEEQGLKLFNTEEGLVLIERRGDKVLIIEGATQSHLAEVQNTLWKEYKATTATALKFETNTAVK